MQRTAHTPVTSRPAPSRRPGPRRRRPTRLAVEALDDRVVPATFTVTTDANDGMGSLRQAILDSNTTVGPDRIEFNIGGGGVQTIQPTAALPTITDPVEIDGTTQPGYEDSPVIVLNGSSAGLSAAGLRITAGNSTVAGLVINGFGADGIVLSGAGGNAVVGNYIGTDAGGSAAVPNGGSGIYMNSPNNIIGGPGTARNVISGNTEHGLTLDAQANGNRIQGNFIGTDVTGTHAIRSTYFGSAGMYVVGGDNIIGGTAPGAGNLISGNRSDGINLNGFRNVVQGNLIGTDVTGTLALGNNNGIHISGPNNTVGGASAAVRNVISGNAIRGISITGNFNAVQGNFIGTTVNGTAKLGNGELGVYVNAGSANTIGGTADGVGNLISGNADSGVFVGWFGGNNVVQGNLVGTDITGGVALGNGGYGVIVYNSSGNLIGGDAAGARNVISGNTRAGVRVFLSAYFVAPPNVIQGNLIGTDAAGARALGNREGVLVDGDARNVLIGGTTAGARNLISGNNGSGVSLFGGSGHLVQGNYIGTDIAGTRRLGNDGAGVGMRTANNVIGGTPPGARNLISGNNGSGVEIGQPEATGNRVEGNLIGTDVTGTIALGNRYGVSIFYGANNVVGGTEAGARNVISGNRFDGVHIEATEARNNAVQGNFIGTDVSGTRPVGNGTSGVWVTSGQGTLIGGTTPEARNLISGNGTGVLLNFPFRTRTQGNYIGTDVTGTLAVPNGTGVLVAYGVGEFVGGTETGAGNLISGNTGPGVQAYGSGSSSLRAFVQGNTIGADVSGTRPLGNGRGIQVDSGLPTLVGGTAAGAGNLISGNVGDGIALADGRNVVQGNRIGTDAAGTAPMGNGGRGVRIAGFESVVGGTEAGAANTIAFNGQAGVEVQIGYFNRVRGNAIHANGGLGIDLKGDGVTPNDPGDADEGANAIQNFPVLSLALAGGSTRITGTLNSTARTTFSVDFYASAAADQSGYGEGARYLGSATITTDAAGNASFRVTLGATTPGEWVTAAATDPNGNTSEFSAAVLAYKEVAIDVKPGDPANRVNLNSNGLLPVAVLTTPDFDATTADLTDLSRIRFGDVNGTARVSPTRAVVEDVDGDGDLDLLLFFSVRTLRDSGALTLASTQVELTGFTTAGTPFRGVDLVSVVNGPMDGEV